jgi:hypothetical protein
MDKLVFEISSYDWAQTPNRTQPALQILKDRGAPIKGTFWLEVEDGWKITRRHEFKKNETIFEFEKLEEK